MSDIVLQNLDQGLLTITMNRPDRRNALNPDMTKGLVEAARRAGEGQEVCAGLREGAGGQVWGGRGAAPRGEGAGGSRGAAEGRRRHVLRRWRRQVDGGGPRAAAVRSQDDQS